MRYECVRWNCGQVSDVGWGFVGGGSLAWQHLVSSLDVSKQVVSLRNSSILVFILFFWCISVCFLDSGVWNAGIILFMYLFILFHIDKKIAVK